jgi:muramoyltetrapeptide carboxypeptidase
MNPHPKPLTPGDRVQLAAASSALGDLERLEAGVAVLRSWGLQVEPHPTPLRRWGYMAGSDPQRLEDLAAPSGLTACVRGGWGAARLLELAEEPGSASDWLLGFSDVTSLLWARWARGRGGGIHGPLVTTLAAEPAWSQERLWQLLFGEPLADLEASDSWGNGTTEVVEGPLLVGNLTVASHLLGTRHLPDLRGALLVLEDVGEAPYRVERMLTQWRLAGNLQQLGGLGFGSFSGCDGDGGEDGERPSGQHDQQRFSLEQVLRERTADLGIPVLAGLPVGHQPGNGALPIGTRARLDGRRGRLQVLG